MKNSFTRKFSLLLFVADAKYGGQRPIVATSKNRFSLVILLIKKESIVVHVYYMISGTRNESAVWQSGQLDRRGTKLAKRLNSRRE